MPQFDIHGISEKTAGVTLVCSYKRRALLPRTIGSTVNGPDREFRNNVLIVESINELKMLGIH